MIFLSIIQTSQKYYQMFSLAFKGLRGHQSFSNDFWPIIVDFFEFLSKYLSTISWLRDVYYHFLKLFSNYSYSKLADFKKKKFKGLLEQSTT